MSDPSLVLATCHEAAQAVASFEIAQLGCSVTVLVPGVLACKGQDAFARLSKAASTGKILFVRHLAPVQVQLNGVTSAAEIAPRLAREISLGGHTDLSVHVRMFGSAEDLGRPGDLARELEDVARASGSTIRRKNPLAVLSVLISGTIVYAGLACSAEMLSSWSGGDVRYREDDEVVSRAEFKLLEALEVFQIPLSQGETALDLGASPGGWSRVLASKGIDVTAVDPAPLDDRCQKAGRITYVQKTAQAYSADAPASTRFAVITNDMKMDADESAEMMNALARLMQPGGKVVMTLKLRHAGPAKTLDWVKQATEILCQNYTVRGARQLFHNRSEVTLYLERHAR